MKNDTSTGTLRLALRNRGLVRHLLGLQFAATAEWAVFLGVLVYAFDDGGAAATGIASIAMLVPTLVVAPYAGSLPERHRPQRVRVAGIVLQGLSYALGATLAFAGAHYGLVLAAVTIGLAAVTTLRPAGAVLLPALVRSSRELTAGNVWTSFCENLSSLVGPLMATGLLAVGGAPAVIAGCAAATTVATIVTFLPALIDPPAAGVPGNEGVLRALSGNLSELRRRPGLTGVIAIAGAQYVLLGGLDIVIVVVASDRLDLDAAGPGWLFTLVGLGSLAGGIVGARLLGRERLSPAMIVGLWGIALASAALAAALTLLTTLILLTVIGLTKSAVDLMARVLLHRSAPPEALGSVFAVLETAGGVGLIVGSAGVQLLVAAWGVEASLYGLAVFFAAVAALAARSLHLADDSADVPVVQMSLLRQLPVFSVLPRAELEIVARAASDVPAAAGETIIREGESGDRFYAVADGEFDVTIDGTLVGVLKRGDGFGEIALLADVPRQATVTSRVAGALLAIDRGPFLMAITGHDSSNEAAWGHIRTLRGDRASSLVDASDFVMSASADEAAQRGDTAEPGETDGQR